MPRGRRTTRWLVFALVVGAAALRFYRIGHQSYWIDEILTIRAANIGLAYGLSDFIGNIQGPLHAFLVHLVGSLSTSEIVLRGISAAAGVASVPIFYLLGVEIVSRRAGMIAGLLGALSPFAVWYSQEVRNYSLLILLSSLSTLLLHRIVHRDGRGWIAYVLAAAAGCYLNLSAFFLVLAQNVVALGRGARDRRFLVRWIASQAVVLVLVAPAIVGLARWTGADEVANRVAVATDAREEDLLRGATTFTPMALPYSLYVMAYGFSLGPSLTELHVAPPAAAFAEHLSIVVPACLAVTAVLLLGLRGLAGDRSAMRLVLSIGLVPIAMAMLLALLNVKPFNPRYVAVSFPSFLVLAGAGVGFLRRSSGAVLVSVLILLFASSLWNYYTEPRYWREDVRGVARYIEENERPGDKVLVPVVLDVFNHYYRGAAPRLVIYRGHAGSEGEVREQLRLSIADARRLWFVDSRLWSADPGRHIPGYLNASFARTDDRSFPGARVSLFELDSGPAEE